MELLELLWLEALDAELSLTPPELVLLLELLCDERDVLELLDCDETEVLDWLDALDVLELLLLDCDELLLVIPTLE